ncbi:unnamed protein product [Moneuplotes crassus]|uniref:Uncharacterized protein n=1 Tax=Euplotes crassus TaxID=5936 RepID=A0AAD1Y5D8_EUPCR|nr:unnamed protein product [Moneuplotes crassus]
MKITALTLIMLLLTFVGTSMAQASSTSELQEIDEVGSITGCIGFAWSVSFFLIKFIPVIIAGDSQKMFEMAFEIPRLVQILFQRCLN